MCICSFIRGPVVRNSVSWNSRTSREWSRAHTVRCASTFKRGEEKQLERDLLIQADEGTPWHFGALLFQSWNCPSVSVYSFAGQQRVMNRHWAHSGGAALPERPAGWGDSVSPVSWASTTSTVEGVRTMRATSSAASATATAPATTVHTALGLLLQLLLLLLLHNHSDCSHCCYHAVNTATESTISPAISTLLWLLLLPPLLLLQWLFLPLCFYNYNYYYYLRLYYHYCSCGCYCYYSTTIFSPAIE